MIGKEFFHQVERSSASESKTSFKMMMISRASPPRMCSQIKKNSKEIDQKFVRKKLVLIKRDKFSVTEKSADHFGTQIEKSNCTVKIGKVFTHMCADTQLQ